MEPLQYEERGYLKEPFRLFHLADGRGEYIEYHYHAFHKIIILLAGKAGYAVEGERYELNPGDFVLVGRGSIHRPVVAEGDYYERMILYIAPEYLRSLTAGDCDPSECFRRAQETFQYVYRDENGSRVRPLFQALAETIRQGGYGAALLAGVAGGFWHNTEEAAAQCRLLTRLEPCLERRDAYEKQYARYCALYRFMTNKER